MMPSNLTCYVMAEARLVNPPLFFQALYVDVAPHNKINPSLAIPGNTASRTSSPALSKYTSMPFGATLFISYVNLSTIISSFSLQSL